MKVCPNCRTEYTDDGLQYCLQDGTPLLNSSNRSSNFDAESETVISPRKVEPIRFEPPSSFQNSRTNRETDQPLVVEREPKKSNTATVVALSVLGTILVSGLVGAGVWVYFGNKKTVAVANTNSTAPTRSSNASANNNQSANTNTNTNTNANANLAAPTLSPTPTAKPTINPEQAKNITGNVKDVVDDWKSAAENLDITSHLSNYADTVDYYNGGKVGVAKIRADKERAFSQYDSVNFNIDNLRVSPDPSGDKATTIFDKEWRFEGADKYSAGKVQQQLTLNKINGKWLITSEKDLKVYYKE